MLAPRNANRASAYPAGAPSAIEKIMHSAATSMLRSIAGQMPSIARKEAKLCADQASGKNGFGHA